MKETVGMKGPSRKRDGGDMVKEAMGVGSPSGKRDKGRGNRTWNQARHMEHMESWRGMDMEGMENMDMESKEKQGERRERKCSGHH